MPDNGTVRLLSIGRFCYAKNFDNIPEICRIIVNKGIKINWYLIGYGGDENLIRQKICDTGMQNNVFILGRKNNPYPYISACDIYVQPSRYEGNSVTVHEAQTLQKPVVITRFSTSSSQLKDGYDGVIVPMDNEGCVKGIIDLIQDDRKRKKLIDNCASTCYSNTGEVAKIYALI